jgi:hypothetical protein
MRWLGKPPRHPSHSSPKENICDGTLFRLRGPASLDESGRHRQRRDLDAILGRVGDLIGADEMFARKGNVKARARLVEGDPIGEDGRMVSNFRGETGVFPVTAMLIPSGSV